MPRPGRSARAGRLGAGGFITMQRGSMYADCFPPAFCYSRTPLWADSESSRLPLTAGPSLTSAPTSSIGASSPRRRLASSSSSWPSKTMPRSSLLLLPPPTLPLLLHPAWPTRSTLPLPRSNLLFVTMQTVLSRKSIRLPIFTIRSPLLLRLSLLLPLPMHPMPLLRLLIQHPAPLRWLPTRHQAHPNRPPLLPVE